MPTAKKPRVPRAKKEKKAAPGRDYEKEFIQAFEEAGCYVRGKDITEVDDLMALLDSPTGITVEYQYKPKVRYIDTGRVSGQMTLDFAIPDAKIYLEFDGYFARGGNKSTQVGGHRNWSGFHRDRRKDRTLIYAGWRGFRFGPADARDAQAVANAVGEFLRLYDKIKHGDI